MTLTVKLCSVYNTLSQIHLKYICGVVVCVVLVFIEYSLPSVFELTMITVAHFCDLSTHIIMIFVFSKNKPKRTFIEKRNTCYPNAETLDPIQILYCAIIYNQLCNCLIRSSVWNFYHFFFFILLLCSCDSEPSYSIIHQERKKFTLFVCIFYDGIY